jgi:DNA-binding PadR family transcriptional regulator
VVAEEPAHGFAVAKVLAPDGELGGIWTVKRALVYRSLDQLEEAGLIEELSAESGDRGPARTPVRITREGRRALERWTLTPVSHIRDFRHELLLKLAFLVRGDADLRPLLEAQLDQLQPIVEGLANGGDDADGVERLVAGWRAENARAAERFVKRLAEDFR